MSSYRLPVLIPEGLQRRVRKAAQRSRMSTGAWVRQAIERQLLDDEPATDPLERGSEDPPYVRITWRSFAS
jgi:hypothetical protein